MKVREEGERSRPDFVLIIGSIVVVACVVTGLLMWPVQAQEGAHELFGISTRIFGAPVQVIGLLSLVFVLVIALSKIGTIKLGDGDPEYSTISWLFMFITAGLGSATMYWAFMEWAYYFTTPGLNLEPYSRQALDMSLAYAFFHWGPIPWAMYVAAGIPMAYYFHVKRGGKLSFAGIIQAISGDRLKAEGLLGRVVDILFLFTTFGGLILTVTVTVNTVSAGFSKIIGVDDAFWLQALILVVCCLLFGLSSYAGLKEGLQKLAKVAVYGTFLFSVIVLILGPSEFIVLNTVNAVGLELQNFVHMALFTDPNGGGSFARDWTVFYWLYWISYLPGVAIFITRVSKGRTIRQTVLGIILAGACGIMFMFGILSSYSIHAFTSGAVNAPDLLNSVSGEFAVAQLLLNLPCGAVFSVVYFLIMLIFLASHLDATAFTISTVSTQGLEKGQDPARALRMFWVLMLGAIPLAMLAIRADLATLKTGLTLTAIPFVILLCIIMAGFIRWVSASSNRSLQHREQQGDYVVNEE